MKRQILYTTLAGVVTCILTSETTLAANWNTCSNGAKVRWKYPQVVLVPSLGYFAPNTPLADALKEAVGLFSDTPGNFKYVLEYDFDGFKKIAMGNGRSEVWMSDTMTPAGVCYSWTNSNCELIETDILFKVQNPWTTTHLKSDMSSYGGSKRPFQNAALHELGHAQGLGHTSEAYSIMGADYSHLHTSGLFAYGYPGQDAVFASMEVYGKKSTYKEDVAVSHWRAVPTTSEYSSHARTRILDEAGAETLVRKTIDSEPVYVVKRGQTVRPEFTFENLGKTAQGFQVMYVISEDWWISTSDWDIKTTGMITGGDAPFTYAPSVTIPTWLTPGKKYWLGVYCNVLAAFDEPDFNNTAYIGIEVFDPDFVAKSISGPTKVKAGKTADVWISMDHANDFDFAGFSIVLSKDTAIGPDDLLVYQETLSQKPAQLSKKVSFAIPETLKGKYYWGLIISASAENNTTNNAALGGKVKIKKKKKGK